MSNDKLVAVVGHSLVPQSIGPIDGVKVEIFRSPGARISTFHSNPKLSNVLYWTHDLTILFIGGNDINDNCVPAEISENIQNLIEEIHTTCNSHIAFVLIEHRNPPPDNRFNVTASNYNRIATNINNRLKRKYKNKSYVQFVSVGAKPFKFGVTDGIHFDRETKTHLITKLRNAIRARGGHGSADEVPRGQRGGGVPFRRDHRPPRG